MPSKYMKDRKPGRASTSRTFASARVKRRAPYLKTTTRKGAYGKGAKRNFQKRRAPFVETKQQTDQIVAIKAGVTTATPVDDILLTTEQQSINFGTFVQGGTNLPNTLTVFPVQAFLQMNNGLGTTDIVGASVFSRYLKTKIEFQLPWGQNQIKHPCDMYLIHGWVTLPLGANDHTTPSRTDMTRENVQDHIQEQVIEYFNQRTDKLQYIPKKTNNLKIEGYRKLKLKNHTQMGAQATWLADGSSIFSYGSPPLINMECNWTTKRKVHYVQGKSLLPPGPSGTSLPHMYPNYTWLPFFALYVPSAIDFLSDVTYPGPDPQTNNPPQMFIRYNSAHYFSDS